MSCSRTSGGCSRGCAPPSRGSTPRRSTSRPSTAPSSSSTSCSCSSSSASSTPARAPSSTPCSAARCAQEGVTPTTAQINVLQYGDTVEHEVRESGAARHHRAGAAAARHPHRRHARHQRHHPRARGDHRRSSCRASDLVLFVTSADRPFTETERAFLEQIRDWGKKIVIVINKIDILDGRAAGRRGAAVRRRQRAARCSGSARRSFRSARGWRSAPSRASRQLWAASRFEALERYIRDDARRAGPRAAQAAQSARRRRVARRNAIAGVVAGASGAAEGRLRDARRSRAAARDVRAGPDARLRVPHGRHRRILLEMERRGQEYFDDTMRIGRVMDLLNRSRVQEGFEQQVVADAPQQIERKVGELVDWLVDADLRQWQAVTSASRRAPPPVPGPHRRRRGRGRVSLRSHAPDRCGRPRGAAGRRFLRSPARGAASWPTARATPSPAAAAVGAGAVGLGAHRHHRGDHRGGRRDRHHHGVGDGRARVLHPAGEAQAGRRRRCGGRSPPCAQRLSDALREQFWREIAQERRPHPREHRPLQPVRARRRG